MASTWGATSDHSSRISESDLCLRWATCADVLAGNIEGVATQPWTAAQVAQRRHKSLSEILEEWSEVAPQVEAMASNFPMRVDEQWVLDLTTHEQDVRGALAAPGARDAAGVMVGVD